MTWRNDALCAGSLLWLEDKPNRRQKRWMASVCALCVVKTECGDEAERWRMNPPPPSSTVTTTYPVGVWAGRFYAPRVGVGAEPVEIPLGVAYGDPAA